MGNVCCGGGNSEMLARQELLKEGNDFKKKSAFLGVLSRTENVHLQLNSAGARLMWRQTPGPSSSEELPVYRIGKVCPMGRLDLVLLGQSGQKLLELTAETTTVRDLWVQTLEELCLADQAERYRTDELEKRRREAEERKKKIGVIGMKYTAQAMANR
ncbi:hypothetical protein PInf_025455 [Phytophthora infestans]|nr:hypothetical protein PInf_025455 [Phytophthora infestans]